MYLNGLFKYNYPKIHLYFFILRISGKNQAINPNKGI